MARTDGRHHPERDQFFDLGLGVHVVGVSALGRGTPLADRAGLVTASLAMDDLLTGSGVAYRALASPSSFENLLEEAASIRDKGVFSDAAHADRKAPMVAVAHIAAADLVSRLTGYVTAARPTVTLRGLLCGDFPAVVVLTLRAGRDEKQSS